MVANEGAFCRERLLCLKSRQRCAKDVMLLWTLSTRKWPIFLNECTNATWFILFFLNLAIRVCQPFVRGRNCMQKNIVKTKSTIFVRLISTHLLLTPSAKIFLICLLDSIVILTNLKSFLNVINSSRNIVSTSHELILLKVSVKCRNSQIYS